MRLSRTTVVCQEWTELVTDYLEGALPRRLVRAIHRHLSSCPHCTEYLAQMRRTIEITGSIHDEQPDQEFLDVLERAFLDYRSSS